MTDAAQIALAPNPIYWTVQGEGHLRGFQMCFLRLAGCSVGCQQCDTDYTVFKRETAETIAWSCNNATPTLMRDRWVWITGGEPTDHNLRHLIAALRGYRFSIAVATAGHARLIQPVDWLSVSPHDPKQLVQCYGNEIKLVDGLHGLDMDAFIRQHPDETTDFFYRYVQPLSVNGVEQPESVERCRAFLDRHPNWALSRQDHLHWKMA